MLNRLADGGAPALVGVIISGFAFGSRPNLRRPADWGRRAVLTGVVAAVLNVLAFRNGCGTVSALLCGVTAGAIGADGVPADPAAPSHGSGGSGASSHEYVAPPESLQAVWAAEQLGAMCAVVCLLVHGLRAVPVDLGSSVDGRALLANDRRTLGTCVLTAAVVGAAVRTQVPRTGAPCSGDRRACGACQPPAACCCSTSSDWSPPC